MAPVGDRGGPWALAAPVLVRDWGESVAVVYAVHDGETHLVSDLAAAVLQTIRDAGVPTSWALLQQEFGPGVTDVDGPAVPEHDADKALRQALDALADLGLLRTPARCN